MTLISLPRAPTFNLGGKRALVTGAGRGIGLGAAAALARTGSITPISAQLGHVGAAERSLYVASKFAVEGMVKALAVELGRAGIRVNAIAPTFIDTPLTRSYDLSEQALDAVRARIKLGRIGPIEDLMGAIGCLASDASALVTGTSLLVHGGWTAD